ncbi:MAG: hypothetical protein KKB51_15785 [Candidatus Riflebacteria bacterium]|nr:hypothetical protein [Candidatus Riflebacteria bacterium]
MRDSEIFDNPARLIRSPQLAWSIQARLIVLLLVTNRLRDCRACRCHGAAVRLSRFTWSILASSIGLAFAQFVSINFSRSAGLLTDSNCQKVSGFFDSLGADRVASQSTRSILTRLIVLMLALNQSDCLCAH